MGWFSGPIRWLLGRFGSTVEVAEAAPAMHTVVNWQSASVVANFAAEGITPNWQRLSSVAKNWTE